ncbi:MAG: alpha/beta hydrolase [Clostridia bacterium]|nr:alpha/beta hydrolase [Clostridia bacterium]
MILTAESGGRQADYLRFGEGKTPLVIVPGLSLPRVLRSADEIEAAYSAFSKDYTVYLFDRIKNPPEGYSLSQMADDTAELIKAAGIENACFFGTSQGGMLVLLIAARHPALVSKVVAASTAAKSDDCITSVIGTWARLAKEKNIPALAENTAEYVFSPATLKNAKDMIIRFNSDVSDDELRDFAVFAGACLSFDFTAELENITCPALITGSKGDRIMPSGTSEYIAQHIKGAQLYMYDEKYGHAVYDETPAYKTLLLEFFGR